MNILKKTMLTIGVGLLLINGGAQANAAEKVLDARLAFMEQEITQLKQMIADLQQRLSTVEAKAAQNMSITPQSLLLWASENGQAAVVQDLLNKGTAVNSQDAQGRTPLILAAEHGQADIVKILVAKGADLNMKDQQGRTALRIATDKGYGEITQILLDKVEELLKNRAAEKSPETPSATTVPDNSPTPVVSKLDQSGYPPLLQAATEGNTSLAQELIGKGDDVNVKTDKGYTALMLAASGGYGAITAALLEKGADLNAQTDKGYTALMFAAIENHREIVQFLLERGADHALKTDAGSTALSLARENGNKEIVRLLENAELSIGLKKYKVVVKHEYASGQSQDLAPVWKEKARALCNNRAYKVLSYDYYRPASDDEQIIGTIECE